jgi:hypothetical protein
MRTNRRLSAISKTGCGDAKISADTAGTDVTCTATSRGGATQQTVTIKRDTVAPDLTVPTVVVQQATEAGGAAVNFTTGATDALDSAPVIACTPAPGTVFAVGTGKVTLAGGTSRTVTVKLNDAGRKRLKRARKLRVQFKAAMTVAGRQRGLATRTLTLRGQISRRWA